jgi:hypothetical protein
MMIPRVRSELPGFSVTSSGRVPYRKDAEERELREVSELVNTRQSIMETAVLQKFDLQFPELRLIQYDCGGYLFVFK